MKIAVIGTGNMGSAIIRAILKMKSKGISLFAWDKNNTVLKNIPKQVPVIAPQAWFKKKIWPDVVIIAVKPQDMGETLSQMAGQSRQRRSFNPLWISIAAGVNIKSLEKLLGSGARLCRVMPNTPAQIGEGMSAYTMNKNCKERDSKTAEIILSSFGKCIQVPEKHMDVVTGLSGSGPAYVYLFIESLIEGGVAAGLPYAVAKKCAVQTVLGAAAMVERSDESPSDLKSKVTSPGGTTIAGLMALEENRFKFAVAEAVKKATARSVELGKQ
ncbi:MAG: pyrroline-5-carboxylate reductase [Chitinivibrionales bacterium]|nr:pyrroline-5-carboxylate reductase [Chitinivibrionales bacterium]